MAAFGVQRLGMGNCENLLRNYSVEKILGECKIVEKNELSELRKDICREKKCNNSTLGKEKREILNKTFNKYDKYHTKIKNRTLENSDKVADYLLKNMLSSNVKFPIYECVNGNMKKSNKKITESKLEDYPEGYLKKNGDDREAVKLFFKLSFTCDNKLKQYEIQTRTKGNWFSGSIQFQAHKI